MNDFTWIAPTIAALSALVVAVIGAWRSSKNGRDIAVVAADTAKVVEHTNGTLTTARNTEKLLMERVGGLERALDALQKSGALAATTAAQAATDVREAQAVMPPTHEPEAT